MKYFFFCILVLILSTNCSMNQTANAKSSYSVTPAQANTDNYTLTVVLGDLDDGSTQLEVLFSRAPDLPRINANDVSIFLTDVSGNNIATASKPSGELTEVGGSLSTTSAADYIFEFGDHEPEELTVEYQGNRHVFAIEVTSD